MRQTQIRRDAASLNSKTHDLTSQTRAERKAAFVKLGAQVRQQAAHDLDWRIATGQSPNPWGGDFSAGYRVMQIISRHKLSKLEQRSLLEKESS